MASLTSIYESLATPGGDPDQTAQMMGAAIMLSDDQYEILRPVLRLWCVSHERTRVRQVERRSIPVSTSQRANYRELLDEGFVVPGVGFISWGDATVEHHRARIAMLVKERNGLDETIGRHEHAIFDITAAGVTCLREIPED